MSLGGINSGKSVGVYSIKLYVEPIWMRYCEFCKLDVRFGACANRKRAEAKNRGKKEILNCKKVRMQNKESFNGKFVVNTVEGASEKNKARTL